jgi:hypothetical protein
MAPRRAVIQWRDAAARGPRPAVAALAVLTATLTLYLAMPLHSSSGDTFANVLTAVSLLEGECGRIDTLATGTAPGVTPHRVYLLERRGGGWVSPYGVGVPAALLPVYGLARLAGMPDEVLLGDAFNRTIAAAWSALAVTLFFVAARRWDDPGAAAFATAALALGTSTLSLLSREVWQHSLLLLLSAAVLALLWRPPGETSAAAAGAAGALAGWGVAARPTALLLVAAWAWLLWRTHRRRLWPFAVGLAPVVLAVAAYQWATFGNPLLPGQLLVGEIRLERAASSALQGLAGVLLSPGRGLFLYSPVLLLVALSPLLGGRLRPAASAPLRAILPPAAAAVAANVLAAAAWKEWWGGFTYGPRYLSDTLVCWGVLLVVALSCRHTLAPVRRRVLLAVAVLLLVVSTAFHAAGLLVDPYGDHSHNAAFQPDTHPETLWRWNEFPPLYNLRARRGRGP